MTCSKIILGDLPELMNEIIQHFQNDHETLHSCILVNRLWCRLAIPLLWEDPFSMKFPKSYHFIEIYLHNFNDDDKIKLFEYGINNNVFVSNTLFNYPYFIKCLKLKKIKLYIKYWIEFVTRADTYFMGSQQPHPNFNQIFELIYRSLLEIFIKNEINLHTIEFPYSNWLIDYNIYINITLKLILQNQI